MNFYFWRRTVLRVPCFIVLLASSVIFPRIAGAQSAATVAGSQATQELRAIVESGRLSELQWQNFSDYQKPVKKFYETGNYELAWIRAGKPTAQALELIAILEDAAEKGLSSKDYDGRAGWQH
jgi:hypothetical protein